METKNMYTKTKIKAKKGNLDDNRNYIIIIIKEYN
jgi:hypothetical protein